MTPFISWLNAVHCPKPVSLIDETRYSQQGGSELLELLHLQTQHIWQLSGIRSKT